MLREKKVLRQLKITSSNDRTQLQIPFRTKNPKRAQQIYQRIFKPDSLFPEANKFLFDANEKYGYNILVIAKLNGTEVLTRKTITPSDLSNEKEVENVDKKENHRIFFLVSSDSEKGEDVDDVEIDYEDSNLEEIKVQILVKSNNIKVPMAKTLNIEPIRYKKVMEKISSIVQKTLKKKVKSKDYTISYKAVNAHGPSNELEDESDFQEFISEYKRMAKI
uniref:Uncharacterized protein n=1 Tax=Rhizophagus irregularis (strain DAOM 181602 / DAOM 197198 / MUCL 43194) TaxID=747089 RepID=U9SWA9_RHIID